MRARSFVQLALVAMVAVAAAAPLSDFSDGTSVTWGGPQDGDDPSQPSGGLLSGSCGYGELQQTQWPFWAVAAISPSSALYTNATRHPMGGCGACLQIECVNDTQGFEVRQLCWPHAAPYSTPGWLTWSAGAVAGTRVDLISSPARPVPPLRLPPPAIQMDWL